MFKKFQQKIILDTAFKRLRRTPLIATISGKGGSGKTTVAAVIALKLAAMGFRIGVGDFDQTPNLVSALGCDPAAESCRTVGQSPGRPVTRSSSHPVRPADRQTGGLADQLDSRPFITRDKWNRFIPLEINSNLKVMSFQMLKSKGEGFHLSGEYLKEHIRQLLYSTNWGKLDYFITDNPSGSYDSLDLQQKLFNKISVIIVTEPHIFSITNCEEFIDNCNYSGINIFGLVENKTHFICPGCGRKAHLLGRPKAKALADRHKIEYLGGIPEEERIANGDISHLANNGFALRTIEKITDKKWNWK